jgi:hypothetical protein
MKQADSWVLCGLFWQRGAAVLARSGGLIGIKAGPNNRSRIRCRKLHWGRAKGARERGKGRDGGARKRTSSDRSDGMGGRSIMKGGAQWLWVGLARIPALVQRCSHRGTLQA